jgi:hypothetical protein
MSAGKSLRAGYGWLELLLVFALLALLLQVFPALWTSTLWALDIRNWPRTFWFVGTWIVLLALVAVRVGPAIYSDLRQRSERLVAQRVKKQKEQVLKEERERLARMKEAMKRRVY